MKKLKFYWDVLKKTVQPFGDSSAFKDASSLAYYSIFSIPGMLIIVIWLAGYFFGQEAIQGEISNQVGSAMGADTAKTIEDLIKSSLIDDDGFVMKIVGIGSLVFGATTVFFQLQQSLNSYWEVEPAPNKALKKFILNRANSLGMILTMGFLMMITMVLSSVISYFGDIMSYYFGTETYIIAQLLNLVVGFIVVMILFAMIFKVLPDVNIPWKSVWAGAFFTTLLFTIGKFGLSFYFAKANPTSAFGTAGTIILVMMWINYSCLILFFGALFTKVYSDKKGYNIRPSRHANWKAEKRYIETLEQIRTDDVNSMGI